MFWLLDFCDHRFYQDCAGFWRCPNDKCSARELFGTASHSFTKTSVDEGSEKVCTSCSSQMELIECVDKTISDDNGCHPPCRRFLDIDMCHARLHVYYVGTHSCSVGPQIKPMDECIVREYFRNHPSGTPVDRKFGDVIGKYLTIMQQRNSVTDWLQDIARMCL